MEPSVIRNRLRAAQKAQKTDSTFIRNLGIAESAFDQGELAYCDKILSDLGY